ncbi:MAG TPA: hypothetical protein VLM40_16980 [Gemmata sp.]|nr:hypothetical protein [Gemmata sp.]
MSGWNDEMERDQPLATRVAEIESRVVKLETALAERSPVDESAMTDRVIARLTAMASESRTLPEGDRVVVLASEAERHSRFAAAPEPPEGVVLEPPPTIPANARSRWFLPQIWSETRLVFRMYFDPRYRVSRTTQFVIPAIGLLLVFNYFLFSVWLSIPVLSPFVERTFAVFLGVVVCMVLSRETARYREVLEYLSKYGR